MKRIASKRVRRPAFVVCVANADYAASLELRKLYPVIEDPFARRHGLVRVIDESGEDYLYPRSYFVSVELPETLRRTLQQMG